MSRNCRTCEDISCPYKSYHWSTGCICCTSKNSLQREFEKLKDFDYKKRNEQITHMHQVKLKADLLELKFITAFMKKEVLL